MQASVWIWAFTLREEEALEGCGQKRVSLLLQ